MKRVLVIEDDPALLNGLKIILQQANYTVLCAMDGTEGYRMALSEEYDLLLLDLALPGKSGTDICRDLRAEGVEKPVIILTSRTEVSDMVLLLKLGADDYVTKPFDNSVLLARVEAHLRRAENSHPRQRDILKFGNVQINFKTHEANRNGTPLQFSTKELDILQYFSARRNEVVTRDQLLEDVWGFDQFPTTRTIDNFILNIRKKIEADPAHPKHFLTVHGAGYKFVI